MSAECCAWIFVVLLSLAIILWVLSDLYKCSSRSKRAEKDEDWDVIIEEWEE